MMKHWLVILLLIPTIALGENRPKVGVILPLTGEAASYGQQFRKGLQLNPKISAIDMIFEDSKFDSKTALGALQKLTSVDKISYLISFGGATCEVLNEQASRQQLVHIAAGCNTARFEDEDSVNFRLDVNESIAARETATYLKKQGLTRVALLYVSNSWGGTIIKHTKAALNLTGLTIVSDVPFDPPQAGDLRSALLRIRASSPDVLFLISLPDLTPLILRQIHQNQWTIPIMSNISVENPEVIRLSGREANGIFYLSVKPEPKSRDIYPNFYSSFPDGNPFAAWGYDSVSLLNNAAVEQSARKALQRTNKFIGAFNSYTFDSHGELQLPYEIREIRDGGYVWKSDL